MIRNISAVITGIPIGMTVNMGLIILGSSIIPIPESFDPMNAIKQPISQWDI